jgi:hypothetical protein
MEYGGSHCDQPADQIEPGNILHVAAVLAV